MNTRPSQTILITGGAGFVGCNLAERLLATTEARVRIYDNMSRGGVDRNVEWLESIALEGRLEIVTEDVRDADALRYAAHDADEIYHLAAQVAVTTSLEDPATDFHVNALGTFNVLEAARLSGRKPLVLYTSTNKVYGSLEHVAVEVNGTRYRASDPAFAGVTEDEKLDFHSPYGCSKGAADQYVRDYARIYDLPAVVFRMSCIAGPRQFGNEDQGWVAHFLYSVLAGRPITLYGDGYQVRDILHVYDLLDAFMAVRADTPRSHGQIYNVGGGMERAISVREMLQCIEVRTGTRLAHESSEVRPGDQPLYISNTARLEQHTGWHARRSLDDILEDIHAFWIANEQAILASRPTLRRTQTVPV